MKSVRISTMAFVLTILSFQGKLFADMGALWVTGVDRDSVRLDWSEPSGNHASGSVGDTRYTLSWKRVDGGPPSSPSSVDLVGASIHPFEVGGLAADTLYEFRLETFARKITSDGRAVNPKPRLAGVVRQRTRADSTSPVVVVDGAGDQSISVRLDSTQPVPYAMVRFVYKKSLVAAQTITLKETASDIHGPSTEWVKSTSVCGWIDVPSHRELAVFFPDRHPALRSGPPAPATSTAPLDRGSEYAVIAYGFHLGSNAGVEIGEARVRTGGNQPVISFAAALANDHPDVLGRYVLRPEPGSEPLADLIDRFEAIREQILIDESIDIRPVTETLRFTISELPATFEDWQEETTPTLDAFLASEYPELYDSLPDELDRVPLHFRRGDANSDGAVDIADAIATLGNLFLGGHDPSCYDAADANDDGWYDMSDPVFVLGNLFLGGTVVPAPGTRSCGIDPTNDGLDCAVYTGC